MPSSEGRRYRDSEVEEAADEESPIGIGFTIFNGVLVLGDTDAIGEDEGAEALEEADDGILVFEDWRHALDPAADIGLLALLNEQHLKYQLLKLIANPHLLVSPQYIYASLRLDAPIGCSDSMGILN